MIPSIFRECHYPFASKLICEDCGGIYGRKTWHSTDQYKTTIYQCNKKFDKHCHTPNIKEDEVKTKFLLAYEQLLSNKDKLLKDIDELIALITSTEEEDLELAECIDEQSVIEEMNQKLIDQKKMMAEVTPEFERKEKSLKLRFEKNENAITEIKGRIELKKKKASKMNYFRSVIERSHSGLLEWNKEIWMMMVDSATIHRDKTITFRFMGGQEIRV